jgi:transposase
VWHHVSTKPIEDGGRGPKDLTGGGTSRLWGRVDLTRDADGRTRARLLAWFPADPDRPARIGSPSAARPSAPRVQIATLDPFRGYKNAIDDQLDDARAVLDAFHVVKLATGVVDKVRRRVQHDIHGHRSRKDDPLDRIRNILRADAGDLTDRQRARLDPASAAAARHVEVEVVWSCAQQVRSAYHQDTPAGRWRTEYLGYFDTNGAINGLIELHRRIARGFRNRDNYRPRMLLIGGGLDPSPHTHR